MKPRILFVDDVPAARYGLKRALGATRYEILEAIDGEGALEEIERSDPDLLICDIQMPKLDGISLLKRLAGKPHLPPVIMITAYGSERIAVDAMKAGAYDYLSKPYEVDELRCIVENALETVRLRRENEALRAELRQRAGFGTLIGRSKTMEHVYDTIGKVSGTDATVLIYGESGTGKELVARTIHAQSGRKEGPFIAMNCAALPTELIESELFGHEKGTFTGAINRRLGKFEVAHRGTLFLDEIGDMSPETQAKLLRVLQERTFERLGGTETIAVDVRVISATNKDLPSEIAAGRFREDLYYRLKVVDILLPPLRERREDIPLLIHHFRERWNTQHRKTVVDIPPEVMKILIEYRWPGNVRQLMNVIERAVVLSDGPVLKKDLLPEEVQTVPPEQAGTGQPVWREGVPFQNAKHETVRSFEIAFISAALSHHRGNVSTTASAIGMKRQALQEKVKELGIDPRAYRL
ncbi:MAG: sigma-54-dependent Fis family transcriptional regulator [Candidatus Latescibacteria bacterium]|nr:sigma-54-dependent Fis family transcriptional regulator [Candidatus Latescibacterota bacterium]